MLDFNQMTEKVKWMPNGLAHFLDKFLRK